MSSSSTSRKSKDPNVIKDRLTRIIPRLIKLSYMAGQTGPSEFNANAGDLKGIQITGQTCESLVPQIMKVVGEYGRACIAEHTLEKKEEKLKMRQASGVSRPSKGSEPKYVSDVVKTLFASLNIGHAQFGEYVDYGRPSVAFVDGRNEDAVKEMMRSCNIEPTDVLVKEHNIQSKIGTLFNANFAIDSIIQSLFYHYMRANKIQSKKKGNIMHINDDLKEALLDKKIEWKIDGQEIIKFDPDADRAMLRSLVSKYKAAKKAIKANESNVRKWKKANAGLFKNEKCNTALWAKTTNMEELNKKDADLKAEVERYQSEMKAYISSKFGITMTMGVGSVCSALMNYGLTFGELTKNMDGYIPREKAIDDAWGFPMTAFSVWSKHMIIPSEFVFKVFDSAKARVEDENLRIGVRQMKDFLTSNYEAQKHCLEG